MRRQRSNAAEALGLDARPRGVPPSHGAPRSYWHNRSHGAGCRQADGAMSGSRWGARPVPAKDDSAFPVAVIMISRRGRAENQAAPKMATVSSGMLGKREGREIGF